MKKAANVNNTQFNVTLDLLEQESLLEPVPDYISLLISNAKIPTQLGNNRYQKIIRRLNNKTYEPSELSQSGSFDSQADKRISIGTRAGNFENFFLDFRAIGHDSLDPKASSSKNGIVEFFNMRLKGNSQRKSIKLEEMALVKLAAYF